MTTQPPNPENGTMPERLQPVDEMLDEHERPRWDVIEVEVVCSRCAYNLRGLAEPRCPECGLQFPWREVLDSVGRTTNWLFEHNWTKRPLRSYAETVLREMRGPGFWRDISIHHYVTAPPLLIMCLMMPVWYLACSLLLAFILAPGLEYYVLHLAPSGPSGATMRQDSTDAPLVAAVKRAHNMLDSYVAEFSSDLESLIAMFGLALVAFAATAIVLCALRETIARHRLRTVHVLRVVAHSATPIGVTAGVLFPLLCCAQEIVQMFLNPFDNVYWVWVIGSLFSIIALPAILLAAGLKRYLRIQHGLRAAFGACTIGILVPPVFVVLYTLLR